MAVGWAGSPLRTEIAMPHFVGLDASKATTSICIVDEEGRTVREGVVPTEPKAIVGYLRGERRRYRRVGLESMSMASWLYEGLARAGLPVICIEARHAHGVLKARLNKTDRNDARGIAELMRVSVYKAVHIKTRASQEAKLLLAARRHLRCKRGDIDNLIRGSLLQQGLKLQPAQRRTFGRRAAELAPSGSLLGEVVDRLLVVRSVVQEQVQALEQLIIERAGEDPVCRRLMTAPGVGAMTALAYRAAIDVPERFTRSRDVGVHLGLTARTYQSGFVDRKGRISKSGDEAARTALYLAAQSILMPRTRQTSLKTWGQNVAASRGYLKGVIAVARRLAVILHRMWLDGTDFRSEPA